MAGYTSQYLLNRIGQSLAAAEAAVNPAARAAHLTLAGLYQVQWQDGINGSVAALRRRVARHLAADGPAAE